jgi:signal peptidase I
MSFILIFLFFLFLLTLLLLRLSLFVTIVQGESMLPTLIPGDRLLVLHYWPIQWLRKSQIVVGDLRKIRENTPEIHGLDFLPIPEFKEPYPEKFVKRLIGLPGDTIIIHISELHKDLQDIKRPACDASGNLVWPIAPGYCFVRGDGLDSDDSVNWGAIPLSYVSGIVLGKLSAAGLKETRNRKHTAVEETMPSKNDYL